MIEMIIFVQFFFYFALKYHKVYVKIKSLKTEKILLKTTFVC